MASFDAYLETVAAANRAALEAVIATVSDHVPEAEPGLAYGMPAFRYKGRPLIGFSRNRFGLNLYPFDPRIIAALAHELRDYKLGKGVVRFSAEQPISVEAVRLMLELRIAQLEG